MESQLITSGKIPKLTSSNFHGWNYQFSANLAQQKLKRHIEYEKFDDWYQANHKRSEQEEYYLLDLEEASMEKDPDTRKELIKEVRKLYFSDISFWSKEKQKQ
jgi:hypothetical protein